MVTSAKHFTYCFGNIGINTSLSIAWSIFSMTVFMSWVKNLLFGAINGYSRMFRTVATRERVSLTDIGSHWALTISATKNWPTEQDFTPVNEILVFWWTNVLVSVWRSYRSDWERAVDLDPCEVFLQYPLSPQHTTWHSRSILVFVDARLLPTIDQSINQSNFYSSS